MIQNWCLLRCLRRVQGDLLIDHGFTGRVVSVGCVINSFIKAFYYMKVILDILSDGTSVAGTSSTKANLIFVTPTVIVVIQPSLAQYLERGTGSMCTGTWNESSRHCAEYKCSQALRRTSLLVGFTSRARRHKPSTSSATPDRRDKCVSPREDTCDAGTCGRGRTSSNVVPSRSQGLPPHARRHEAGPSMYAIKLT